MDKQAAIDNLNEIKDKYLKAKADSDIISNLYFGEYVGMVLAYLQCGVLSAEEHSNLLDSL